MVFLIQTKLDEPQKTSPRWASYLLTSVILLTAVGLLRDPGEDTWDDLWMWDTKGYQWLPYFQTWMSGNCQFFFEILVFGGPYFEDL